MNSRSNAIRRTRSAPSISGRHTLHTAGELHGVTGTNSGECDGPADRIRLSIHGKSDQHVLLAAVQPRELELLGGGHELAGKWPDAQTARRLGGLVARLQRAMLVLAQQTLTRLVADETIIAANLCHEAGGARCRGRSCKEGFPGVNERHVECN